MAQAAIEFNSVNYTYHAGTSLAKNGISNVSFQVSTGSFTAVIGPTGSGKSTLVNLIAGLNTPTSGEVIIAEHQLTSRSTKVQQDAIQQSVGYVFQFPERQLFANTVWDDVAFGPRNLDWPAEKVQERVQSVLEQVNFQTDRYQQSPLALSGGQQRLAAIAGVLVMQPSILILDEPTAGLDSGASQRLLSILDTLHRTGVTIIMITHHLEYIVERADQVLLMGHGQLQFSGRPGALFSDADLMKRSQVIPPVAVQLGQQLLPAQSKLPMSITELARQLFPQLKAGEMNE